MTRTCVARRITRRRSLAAVAGFVVAPACWADATELEAAIRAFAGGTPVQDGRVTLEIAPLVENGNAVPLEVSVESPMTAADHVRTIALFNEANPQREIAVFTLGPNAGRARVATRIRLATSQRIVALARCSDGSVWARSAQVIVTLAACIEGG